ncbi:MAG: FAD-dependent oxidoreductase [Ardenticatenaceae bacterium]|nr:FAD-dependent oxidoreductase [Ardenticatenaceae bacterium]HBY94438.1 fused response regulator/thioredoxin-disulfide reductase [Chloroflexota bacterium]
MAKPVILTVDDEPTVLSAIARDLRRQYGNQYRVLAADSGTTALETLRQLKLRNESVALFLVDQRMPRMTGVEFLGEAVKSFPEARRALLTAYADTEAAIRAINDIKLDYYLMKPWDPPEENLYPVLTDLLDDWRASFRPPFEGVRVIGHRWSPLTHQVKDFLARNQVPYQWLDIETDEEARRLVESAGADPARLPLTLFPDGSHLVQPTNAELAEKVGLRVKAGLPFYDLIIVGGGPAGLAAAVYGASEGLRTLLIEREAPGGQAGMSSRIENYLGFPSGLSGGDLARRAVVQATRLGAEILTPQEATALRIKDSYRILTLSDGTELSCHVMLIASGVQYRKLDIPGIEALTGAGVYYGAAITEAYSVRDKDVYIVGGGNSAGQAAVYLSKHARTVTVLVRGDSLSATMSQYLIDQITVTPNITVQPYSNVTEVKGEGNLEEITIAISQTGEVKTVPATALFIFIGAVPRTEWVASVIERDKYGFILSGPDLMRDGRRPKGWMLDRDPFLLETNVPGIFVAGDVRHQSIKRVASAVGEGSIAVAFMHQYLAGL